MSTKAAIKRAQKKYMSKLVTCLLKFNPERDEDNLVIEKLKRVKNKKAYIRDLILKDIYEHDFH